MFCGMEMQSERFWAILCDVYLFTTNPVKYGHSSLTPSLPVSISAGANLDLAASTSANLLAFQVLDRVAATIFTSTRDRLVRHPLLDLSRHRHERLFDVRGILGRRFQELHADRVRKLLGTFEAHDLLRGQIALVSHEKLVDVLARVSVDLVQPLLYVVERLLICDIVYDDNTVSAPVIATRDGAEALLASGVPNLKLDRLAVHLDRANLEVDADSRDVALRVRIIRKTEGKRLTDAPSRRSEEA